MSVRIQDALSNCCEGIKEFAFTAGIWIGRTVSNIGSYLGEMAEKVVQFVKPHFENVKAFVQENRESILIASVAFVVGAILTTVVNSVFNSRTPASSSI